MALTLVVLCALVVGGPSVAASASGGAVAAHPKRQAAPAATSEVDSWALAPSGTDPSQPGSRPNLSYTLAPGATVNDSVTLWNYSNVQLTFHVYASDAFNNAAGAFDVLAGDKPPKDIGTWVKFPQDNLTLPPRTSVALPITITVPADARPGDHTGGVLASSQTRSTDAAGHHVVLDRRTGSRIYLRVSGVVKPSLVVENIASTYHSSVNPLGGDLDVTYTVRNAGNVRLAAHQKIRVHDVFGTVDTRKPKDLPELLPGNAITLHQHFTGVAATLRVATDVSLSPFAAPDSGVKAPATTTTTGTTWAIPWSLIALLLVLFLAWRIVRRWQRGRAPGATGQPGGGPPGPRGPDGTGPSTAEMSKSAGHAVGAGARSP